MAIDFPTSPILNQTLTVGGSTWQWDGTAWNIVPVMQNTAVSDAPPANPTVGQFWWRSSNAQLYVYYDDGNTKQWVQTSPGSGQQVLTAQSRNLMVNPVFAITQENGGTAGTANAFYVADQWRINFTASGAAISANVSYTNVNPSGSPGRLLYKTTTAKASLAAGDYAAFYTVLEGARVYPLGWPLAAPAIQAVLRFGFNGPAGTYSVSIRNLTAYTVCWTGQFTITAAQANTDTTQVLVVPPPPGGYAWGGGTSAQIEFWFTFAAGTTYMAPVNGWQAGQFLAGPGQFNMLGTVNNQVQLWDVGFYADPLKTGLPPPFQVPDYSLDLLECSRYYTKAGGQARLTVSAGAYYICTPVYYKVPMRVNPTVSMAPGSVNNLGTNNFYGMDNSSGRLEISSSTNGDCYNLNAIITAIARM